MTIKEAIEYWEQFKAEIDDLYDTCSDVERDILAKKREVLEFTISALHTQQEKPFGGWISVKDKLPEDDQCVILCTRETETYGKNREKKKIYKNIYTGYFDGYEWLTNYCYGCEYIFRMNEKYPNETIEVTHWMPLQELPKGE